MGTLAEHVHQILKLVMHPVLKYTEGNLMVFANHVTLRERPGVNDHTRNCQVAVRPCLGPDLLTN